MPDMLVKLYELPDPAPALDRLAERGITVRRPIPPERHVVLEWVEANFSVVWRSEVACAFGRQPVACFLALRDADREIIGFGCYDVTARGYFGPTGVAEAHRKGGVGTALLLVCLHALRELGHAYGIIGGAGPTDFYHKAAGAVPIPDSSPGIYRGALWQGPASRRQ